MANLLTTLAIISLFVLVVLALRAAHHRQDHNT